MVFHSISLINNAQKGDRKALNQLVDLWYKRIYNYALKYCNDEDLASEIVQKTCIAMFKNIKKLNDAGKFRPWLYRIATNYCHEEERIRKRNKKRFVSSSEGNTRDDETKEIIEREAKDRIFRPDKKYQQLELQEILSASLDKLDENQRNVVIMKEYEQLKFKEIAEVLNISENTAKTRLYTGLKNLKKILEENNITKETVYYEL